MNKDFLYGAIVAGFVVLGILLAMLAIVISLLRSIEAQL